jgi:hypothetical protein
MQRKNSSYKKLWIIRLFKRQEVWILTFQGWLVALGVFVCLLLFTITNLHSFLAINAPLKSADALVIEGWIPDYAIKEAVDELENSNYRMIITTGGNLEKGTYLTEYKNFAEVSVATLKKIGVDEKKIFTVPAPPVLKDRSYISVVEFRKWITRSNLQIKAINLVSWDAHARRSWLFFKKVLSPEIKVGIIASNSQGYDPERWWTYSEGVRTLINELIAYIYAVVFSF